MWIKLSQRAEYLGQCNDLRQCGGEENWNRMMQLAIPVTFEEFKRSVDYRAILDDENDKLEEFGAEDPDRGYYISKWGERVCYFLKTSGFEFIWIV